MSTDAPFKPPRKKPNILWWVGGIFMLLLFLFSLQLFGPNPRIIVSPQTTYVTQPLTSDGFPDFERYVLDAQREGVTPQNNAAVLLLRALGPGDLNPAEYADVAAEIGMQRIPSKGETLVGPYDEIIDSQINDWLKTQSDSATGGEESTDAAYEVVDQASDCPWTSEQIPPLATWVASNKKPLDLIVEASHRPQCYWSSPTLLNKRPDLLIGINISSVQAMREAMRALSVRAMWHLGEGRPMETWQDLRAIHRLARLTSRGNTLIEQLVAVAIDGIACANTQTLVHHGNLTPKQSRLILRDYSELPRFAGMATSIDRGERLMAIDAFVQLATRGDSELLSALEIGESGFAGGVLRVVSVDWNLVLRATNNWYDRLVKAASLPDRPTRVVALATYEADMQRMFAESHSPTKLLAGVVSRRQRSELVAATMLGLFLPAISAAFDAEDRQNTTLELTRLAIALAVYRAEHGAYPEQLENLAPSVLNALPVDVYNAKPFVYKRDGEGYLLYSPGENGADDGGSNERMSLLNGRELDAAAIERGVTIPAGTDDISIRQPPPPFELPKVAPPSGEP